MTMLWTGPQSAIAAAAALCDAASNQQPQTRGDNSPVPESERMTMRWAEPQQCEHCEMWTLPAPPAEYGVTLPAGVTEMTAEAFAAAHSAGGEVQKTTSTYTACAVAKLLTGRSQTGDLSLLIAPADASARVLSVEIHSTVSSTWALEKRRGPDTGGRVSNAVPLAFDGTSPPAESRCVAYGDVTPTPDAALGTIPMPSGTISGKTFTAFDPSGFGLAPGEALAVQCGVLSAAEVRITWTWAEDRQP